MRALVEIAIGELVDKLTILEIKLERLTDKVQLRNVKVEHDILMRAYIEQVGDNPRVKALAFELKEINQGLWVIEDDIRDCERNKDFGEKFVALARSVYRTNDARSQVKRRINDLVGSNIIEEKSYAAY